MTNRCLRSWFSDCAGEIVDVSAVEAALPDVPPFQLISDFPAVKYGGHELPVVPVYLQCWGDGYSALCRSFTAIKLSIVDPHRLVLRNGT